MSPPADAAVASEPLGFDAVVEWGSQIASVWLPFWASRILVWTVGCAAIAVFGVGGAQWSLDPNNVSSSFGRVGNLLAGPAVRWDAVYYLEIARHGYQSVRDAAFYPLYPILVRAGSVLTGSLVVAGVLISFAAAFAALVIVRRLTELELGPRAASVTVHLIAFGPMAVFLSAVYTESLFLALSAGTFYAARRGRWAAAGVLGALASMERSGGVLLLAPVLIMFFYGPRSDARPLPAASRWRPRFPISATVLWAGLIPLGAAAVAGYMTLRGFGPTATVHAQERYQNHDLVFPVVGAWDGVVAAWHQLATILGGHLEAEETNQSLFQLAALLVSLVALVGVFRRLPLAYGVYCALGLLALHLSSPTIGEPLAGFARYASLRFPLFMFAGAWAVERRCSRTLVLACGLLMVLFAMQFATWQVVGSPTL